MARETKSWDAWEHLYDDDETIINPKPNRVKVKKMRKEKELYPKKSKR